MSFVNSTTLILLAYALIVALSIIAILKFSKDKTRKISSLRLFIQTAAVIAVFMGLHNRPIQPTWIAILSLGGFAT